MKISDFKSSGRLIFAQCNGCGRRVAMDPGLLSPDLELDELTKALKCSKCGSRDVIAIPQTLRAMGQGRDR